MAKKQKKKKQDDEAIVDETLSPVEATLKQLEKQYGAGLATSGQEVADREKVVIPLPPNLDVGTGGIPEGSWVSITGPEKLGKTTLALTFAAAAQRPEYGARPVFFLAPENRLKSRDLKGIRGLDCSPSRFQVIESKKGRILNGKDYLEIAGQFVTDVPGCILIIDSVSALCNPQVMDNGIGIIHFYANVNRNAGMGPAKLEKSASRWKYQADVALIGKYAKAWRLGNDDTSKQIGQEVEWFVKTTATTTPPGSLVTSYLRYGIGYDSVYETLKLGVDVGAISQNKSWYSLEFLNSRPDLLAGTQFEGKEVKTQGAEGAYRLLMEQPAWADALQANVRSLLGQ